jgi:fucose permease
MPSQSATSNWRTYAVLQPAFALTGVLQAIGGALLPALALTFHLSDSDSGLLFLLYFAGTSTGPFFFRARYVRTMVLGFVLMAACCTALAFVGRPLLWPLFLLLGVSVGIPMSGGSLYIGRVFTDRCAPMLSFLNFTWSIGALTAPLLAARVLEHHSYRVVYQLLACAAAAAAIACALGLREVSESARPATSSTRFSSLGLIALFAFAAFLQVGMENTATSWLATFTQRASGTGVALAAASTALYWAGFLASRGVASFLLLRIKAALILRFCVGGALLAAVGLIAAHSANLRGAAMILLGIALAPIYPLVIAGFFARARHTLDSRWVLTAAGCGGSVMPWLAGWISTHSGSLRMGILVLPAALIVMVALLPILTTRSAAAPGVAAA